MSRGTGAPSSVRMRHISSDAMSGGSLIVVGIAQVRVRGACPRPGAAAHSCSQCTVSSLFAHSQSHGTGGPRTRQIDDVGITDGGHRPLCPVDAPLMMHPPPPTTQAAARKPARG
eukprot:scaffold74016_cov50-Phaeocystis_antarctica.AAC.2